MRWSIGRKIASAFGVALAMLLVVGVVSHDSTAKLIDSAEWVRHSHQVVTGLDEFLSAMKDAETGQRGYLITGTPRYLEPYQGARELADQKLKQVRELTADNPDQQQRLATQIAASSQQQMVGMDQVVQAMENIKTASTQNVASTKQTETASRNIGELGRKLEKLVALYKVNAKERSMAANAS